MKRTVFYFVALTLALLIGIETLVSGLGTLMEANALKVATNITTEDYNNLAVPSIIYILSSIGILVLSGLALGKGLIALKRNGEINRTCNILLVSACAVSLLFVGITDTVVLFKAFKQYNEIMDSYKGTNGYSAASYLYTSEKYVAFLTYSLKMSEIETLIAFSVLSFFKFKRKEQAI